MVLALRNVVGCDVAAGALFARLGAVELRDLGGDGFAGESERGVDVGPAVELPGFDLGRGKNKVSVGELGGSLVDGG